ncbi:hypothetical protein EGT29_24705 [Pigmentiphaga sp. H8]|uniref:hypothetical protein n=1 Tax=Pigmentiphaga sp. H8 TaxID=2488560 RepID=UPI000F59DB26|nr:hypothetical protein [Pigmentiphaga sp. H8]AZG10829.1 hypothetical protein EGT29_24705 [Pigmentiphaga sp. H8]
MARTEQVAIRFDPKTKYLLDLCARIQRRTVTNFVEWAVEESFKQVHISDKTTVAEEAGLLWKIRPGDRLAKLVQLYPALLTYDEQRLIDLINKALAAAGLGTNAAQQSGQQSDFVDENWDIFTRAIEENIDPDVVMEVFLENPPTSSNIERRIAKFQEIIDNLKKLKAELEAAKKDG